MTWREMWIGFGIFFWILGFLRVGYIRKKDPLFNRTFVRPPFLIYLICGMPKAKNIPKGVMAMPALLSQLFGLFGILFGLTNPFLTLQNLTLQEIIWASGTILILIYGWILYKRNVYVVE